MMDAARCQPKGSGYSVIPDLNPEASKLRAKLLSDLRAMEDHDRKKHRLTEYERLLVCRVKAETGSDTTIRLDFSWCNGIII